MMMLEPSSHGVGLAIGQHVDGPVALEIDDDGAVAPAAAPSPVVDADDPRRGRRLDRHRPDQPQQGVAADRHGEARGQAGAGLAAHAVRDGALDLGEPASAAGSGPHGRQPLGEDPTRACRYPATEAALLDLEGNDASLPGQVGQMPGVEAVPVGRRVPAGRAGGRDRGRCDEDGDAVGAGEDLQDREAGWDQRQEMTGQGRESGLQRVAAPCGVGSPHQPPLAPRMRKDPYPPQMCRMKTPRSWRRRVQPARA